MKKRSSKQRFEYIDALRGWAIMGVIIAHAGLIIDYQGILSPIVGRGGLGVQLFFLVSAFTIFYTLGKSERTEKYLFSNFFIKRLMRIAPIYWLGIFLYTLVFGLGSRGWTPGPEMWHYPMHLLFVNLLHPETPSSVVPGGWSISCEVIFYSICPILFVWIRNLKQAVVFCAFAVISGYIFIYLSNSYLHYQLTESFGEILSRQFIYRNIISQIGCFSFGIVLYHTYKTPRLEYIFKNKKIGHIFLGCGLIVFTMVAVGIFRKGYHYGAAMGFLFIALSVCNNKNRLIVNKPIIFLGRISYSAYMYHFLILYVLKNNLYIKNFYLLTTLAFVIVIPLAFFSFLHIEKKFSKFGKFIIQKREMIFASNKAS